MLLPSRATGHDVTTAVPGGHPTTAARFPSTGHRLLASVVPDNDEGPPSAVTVPVAGRPSRSSRRRRRRRDGRLLPFVPSPRRAAVGAAGLGIVAVGLGLAYAQPPTPRASVAPVPTPLTVGPDLPGAGASPSGSGSGSAQPSEPANRPPAPAPTRSMPAATTSSRAPVPSAAPSPPPAPASPTPSAGTSSTEPSPSTTLTPPPAPPAVRILQRGDQGQDVVRLQRLLIRAGYGTATAPLARGSFDAATEAALRTFQHQAGIRGEERDRAVYGPRSRAALERTSATAEG
ncbi:peptidoglycan-binding domain-containing protein [Kitasatospora indigofera]|uniref:peptidoglycan-binding domain-containing protein n=1 Tax=Kitasatospora indigofera TaxID=67307 RepID=UPI0033BEA5DD